MTHREIAAQRTEEFIIQANMPRSRFPSMAVYRASQIAKAQRKAVTSTARLKDTDRFEMTMLAADGCNNIEDARAFAADVDKCASPKPTATARSLKMHDRFNYAGGDYKVTAVDSDGGVIADHTSDPSIGFAVIGPDEAVAI